jgi:hypothetical protein
MNILPISIKHIFHDISASRDMLERFAKKDFTKRDKYAISMIIMRQPTEEDLEQIAIEAKKGL